MLPETSVPQTRCALEVESRGVNQALPLPLQKNQPSASQSSTTSRPGPVYTRLRSELPPQLRARSALSRCSSGSALALSQLLISFFQITESLRQRSDIGRGRCDSKAAPFPYRWASADQTNCSRVLCGPPSFFMSTSVEHFLPLPSS